jgi:phage terminase large subunit-like protein
VAFDPWNATDLVTRLMEQDGLTCIKTRQGFGALSAPSKSLQTGILNRTLRHDGDPILRWNMANVSIESDAAGNIKPSKARSTEKIDGVVALVMAIDRLERNAVTREKFQMLIFGPPGSEVRP